MIAVRICALIASSYTKDILFTEVKACAALNGVPDSDISTLLECYTGIIKRVSWFKSSLLLRIKTVDITNINS